MYVTYFTIVEGIGIYIIYTLIMGVCEFHEDPKLEIIESNLKKK